MRYRGVDRIFLSQRTGDQPEAGEPSADADDPLGPVYDYRLSLRRTPVAIFILQLLRNFL